MPNLPPCSKRKRISHPAHSAATAATIFLAIASVFLTTCDAVGSSPSCFVSPVSPLLIDTNHRQREPKLPKVGPASVTSVGETIHAAVAYTPRRERTFVRLHSSNNNDDNQGTISLSNFLTNLRTNLKTAAAEGFGTRARNVATTMNQGDVVVPLCSNFTKRSDLAQRGVYAGVEYLVCDVIDTVVAIGSDNDDSAVDDRNGDVDGMVSSEGMSAEVGDETEKERKSEQKKQERIITIRPAYPLRPHLERTEWPITLPVSDVPLWLSKTTYEAGTALGTLLLAGTYLILASIMATLIRVVIVPSESMEPTLMPGDVSCRFLYFQLTFYCFFVWEGRSVNVDYVRNAFYCRSFSLMLYRSLILMSTA